MATKRKPKPDDPRLVALSSKALLRRALRRKPDGEAFWKIVRVLHNRGDRATFDAACSLCRDARPEARRLVADVLAKLGVSATSQHPFPQEAATVLLEALHDETQPEVLHSLVSALGHFDDARVLVPLIRFKTYPSFGVRWSLTLALTALSKYNETLAVETLIEMTRDADQGIRDWATFGLGNTELDTPTIRDAMAARLDDSDAQTRAEALYGLAERGDWRVIEAVLREFEPDANGAVLFDFFQDTPGYRLLPALQLMAKAEPKGHKDKQLQAAIKACKTYRPKQKP